MKDKKQKSSHTISEGKQRKEVKDVSNEPRPEFPKRNGGLRKIIDFTDSVCRDPEHNPPGHIALSPGIYEYTCPSCGRTVTFTVPLLTWNINDKNEGDFKYHYGDDFYSMLEKIKNSNNQDKCSCFHCNKEFQHEAPYTTFRKQCSCSCHKK